MGVESTPAAGSTFWFTVRLDLAAELADEGTPLPVSLQELPVLVVDDNATNRRVLVEMLSSWGMRPTAVDSGPAALAALENAAREAHPFALVLLDGRMPDMDGYQTAEAIRATAAVAGVHIVMLSSSGAARDGADLGMRVLTKPVKQSDLFNIILTTLRDVLTVHPRPRMGPPMVTPTRHPCRVLLAEDNPINQTLATRLLEKRGHHVTAVENGREVLAALAREKFDVVLMDVQMPEMDGFGATAAIRAAEEATGMRQPIIALTASAMKGDRERCLEAGMDAYLCKPLNARELYETVESLAPGPPQAPPSEAPTGERVT